MIKADSLKKLSEKIVLNGLLGKLESIGFKYLKSKQHFKRTIGNFDQIISFGTSHSPLEFNENTDELYLKFHINANIESPKFDKWIKKEIKSRSYFRHLIENVKCIELVDFNTLNKDDFFTPTESRKFKNYITSSLIGEDNDKRITFLEFEKKLAEIIKSFDNLNTAKDLYNNKTQAFRDYLRLLVFEGENEQAKVVYLEKYNHIKNQIDFDNTEKVEETKKTIQSLEKFASEIEIFFNLKLENPFKRELKKLESKKEKIKLSADLGFKEHFRFDSSLLEVDSFDINDLGEVLIITEEKEVIKINANGNIKNIGKLEIKDCFKNNLSNSKVKWIENSNTFSCDNYLLSENDELIELIFDFDKTKFKTNEISLFIKELNFDNSKKQYHFLYLLNYKHTYHSIYDEKGQLISTNSFDNNILKLNLARKEYIALSEKNSVDIIDFKGNVKENYKYGNGNESIALSPDGKLMLLHSYSTKSQLYNLENKKKQTLWAHPTFLKNYKENFYNDINHNFGLSTCKFTPGGKHIIGGADHGKYVVWDTKKFERKELIPNESSLKIFNWFTTTISNGNTTENYFKPYSVEYENQNLFINRGYDISKISFLENGKYIITQVSDCLLVWNKDFENIGHVYGIGRVTFSANNFLIYKNKNELVVHRKVNKFNNDFESSIFKEFEKENSNITTHNIEKEDLEVKQIEDKIADIKTKEKKGFFGRLFKK
ncbi:hypothetical protein [Bizionia sp. M204]|uniref:hypothetical protein n=1 Tax=Bizionia sp. M204 TaxID=2675331 RepID=UPI00205135EB|nr:hypothetical protein [Bizionia sp. M204]UPS92074.1 hypothetical protein GMA17_10230 [Bizionia sp. M204]